MVSASFCSSRQPRRRQAITLLEVLIACGLLIIGLSTMAALLPAAGSRLAQASIEDRAGVLVTNAMAELVARGLVAADAFGGTGRSLVVGSVLEGLAVPQALPFAGEPLFAGLSPTARSRCGSPRTFQLEDELIFKPPPLMATPANEFTMAIDGPGPRRFREAICWGAMISPVSRAPTAGGLARLAIAVFRKQGGIGQVMPLTLTRASTYYQAGGLLADDSILEACSWVLALPPADSDRPPRWFQVMSSWRFQPPADPSPRVIFRDQPGFAEFTRTSLPTTTANVLAFDGLVRVDERDVILD